MEKLQDLLFELSSSERMGIMLELQAESLRLSNLSQKLGLANPETSRHLQRLGKAGLVQRDSDGLYGVTPFGKLALMQMSGLSFTVKHRDYFQDYDPFLLPYEFIGRMGELAEGKLFSDGFKALEEAKKRLLEAEEYVWILSDQNLTILSSLIIGKIRPIFDVKSIFPRAAYVPEDRAVISTSAPGVHKRVLPQVGLRVVVTDKAASIGFPLRSNRMNYRAFVGSDARFHKWCRDLFLHYWEEAKPYVPE